MRYGEEHGPLAIAHRGGMALAPENTLTAFERATAHGVDYLETDVVTTRDGHLLCHHDATLRRLTGDRRRVREVDLAHVRRLLVADAEPIPTMAEAIHSFPGARWAIDLKDAASVAAMAELLRANPGWAERICVAGAWSGRLATLQTQVPEVSCALGWKSLTTLISWSRGRARPPRGVARGRFAHVPLRLGGVPVYAERVVDEAHRLGIRVVVWTVNDEPTVRRLLAAGVDGIISDQPGLLRDVVRAAPANSSVGAAN